MLVSLRSCGRRAFSRIRCGRANHVGGHIQRDPIATDALSRHWRHVSNAVINMLRWMCLSTTVSSRYAPFAGEFRFDRRNLAGIQSAAVYAEFPDVTNERV